MSYTERYPYPPANTETPFYALDRDFAGRLNVVKVTTIKRKGRWWGSNKYGPMNGRNVDIIGPFATPEDAERCREAISTVIENAEPKIAAAQKAVPAAYADRRQKIAAAIEQVMREPEA